LYFAGVDIGSTMTKVVLIDKSGNLLSSIKGPTGPEYRRLANEVMRQTLSLFPNVRTAIDIGGQDAKCMKIDSGRLTNFVMNDKCAAGTGRFLEVTAATLGIRLEDMGDISLKATKKIQISNLCTIFAQQEVVALLSRGEKLENILAGLHNALAGRVAALARRLGIEPDLVLTGGVAKNTGIVKAMKESLGCEILVPEEPLLTGALGAAILAKETYTKAVAVGEALSTKSRRLEKATFFNQEHR